MCAELKKERGERVREGGGREREIYECKGSFTLQAEPSRTEPNRFGLENKPTL